VFANADKILSTDGRRFLRQHPLHLHGHNFYVVRSAGSESYNYDNPVIRDVVSIGHTGDNVTIRFFTDNYGPWFFHCHIDWHLKMSVILSKYAADHTDQCTVPSGFAVVFAEDVPEVPTEVVPSRKLSSRPYPSSLIRMCVVV
jgi:iron transport multicopper oxidase